ncbi:ester cyclase [Phaeovulum sp. W22_SRMD_FR3]|uniref:ester cyclase n=1 Tax=Phaeovulum sp. W22_SRMD_FR3 TaxID=3240274 RepID=UPI003F9CDC58
MSQKLQFLQEWYETVWFGGNLDAIDQFFAPASHVEGLMTGLEVSPQEFRELIPAMLHLVADPAVRIERHFETEDWLWALISVSGVSRQSLKPLAFSGQVAMRFSEGKIAEAFNHFDLISFFEQIGALPEYSMALCFSGEQLS